MERDYSGFATGTNYQDFNSHAHVERDQRSNGKTYAVCISTHTLTWSVTFNKGELKDIKTFQLTRSRGAWLSKRNKNHTVNEFQLTRSRGAWRLEKSTPCNHLQISTHTLTWSVTPVFNYSIENIHISTHTLTWSVTSRSETNQRTLWFQLTRSRGAWRQWKTVYSKYVTFQLTRSRGAWLEYSDSRGQTGNFNSHAHVERDLKYQRIVTYTWISTHTLTWSVTPKSACPYQQRFHFNSHAHVERDF